MDYDPPFEADAGNAPSEAHNGWPAPAGALDIDLDPTEAEAFGVGQPVGAEHRAEAEAFGVEPPGGAEHRSGGEPDLAEDRAGGELDLELLSSIEQELADVERALERLGDGSYGSCETCGESVSDDELEATPARRFCRAHLPLDLP